VRRLAPLYDLGREIDVLDDPQSGLLDRRAHRFGRGKTARGRVFRPR
jgi:hypothetical protein